MKIRRFCLIVAAASLAACATHKTSEPPPSQEPARAQPAERYVPPPQQHPAAWTAPNPTDADLTKLVDTAWSDLFRNPTSDGQGSPVLALSGVQLLQSGGVVYPYDLEDRLERILSGAASRDFQVQSRSWLGSTLARGGLSAEALQAPYRRNQAEALRDAAVNSGESLNFILLVTLEGLGLPGEGAGMHRLLLELVRTKGSGTLVTSGRASRKI